MAGHVAESLCWMAKARSSLAAASVLLAQSLFHESISAAYDATFYAAKAMLVRDGDAVSKHSAVIAAFGRAYVKTGRIGVTYHRLLLECFERRQQAQYDAFWSTDQEVANKAWRDAEAFLAVVEADLAAETG